MPGGGRNPHAWRVSCLVLCFLLAFFLTGIAIGTIR